MNSVFLARSDWFPIQKYPRIFLARMTAHEIDNMAFRFLESLNEAQISEINEKNIPINTKKATKFGFGVFQGKVLFLNIILCLSFTREAEIVTLSLFTNFKVRHKTTKIVFFLLHWFTDLCIVRYLFTSVSMKSPVYSPPLRWIIAH